MQISPNHPSLAGHFPGHPIIPGVVLLDAVQSALCLHLDRNVWIAALPAVKFLAPVPPGEPFQVRFGQVRFADATNSRVSFEILVSDQLCVAGTLVPGEM